MPVDLKIDEATNDLVFENGEFTLVYDDDAIIQRLRTRLSDIIGDWFRDTARGTDWYGSILGKRSDVVRRTELRRVILGTEGVDSVIRLELEYSGSARTLTVDFTVRKSDGEPLDVRFEDIL